MNSIANYVKQRMSLREPLKEALDILVDVSETVGLVKTPNLSEYLSVIREKYEKCTDFERDFLSICFSIATGVGKTRLMGACIAYLYLKKGIRNFFVLAPNLTIYEKLIRDFGEPGYAKYVFNGISEFVHNRPVIITGDNYNQLGNLFSDSEVRINIFNVAKFNSETRGTKGSEKGKPPIIKRLSEYLGISYWSYLSSLNDLVILMDEAHRYHADASKNAINELLPVLGIELTATPIDEKGSPFRNVVYEYSLAKALDDGKYIKKPAVATRQNFDAKKYNDDEIEKIKLEDAVSVHRNTQAELEAYSINNNKKKVKPFILVVCRDISHAKDVFAYLTSDSFFEGYYEGKVLQIDSSTKKTEEVEKLFVDLEQYDNQIEIVIHVNMLKEGWDVSNLYTIVPLRAANAAVLIEQTIGRGLRLPYGERTGIDRLDKLTVIAHDNFTKVIEAANDPNSILRKLAFIEIPNEDLKSNSTSVTSLTTQAKEMKEENKRIEQMTNKAEKQEAQETLIVKSAIAAVLPDFAGQPNVKCAADLRGEEVKTAIIKHAVESMEKGQESLFAADLYEKANEVYEATVTRFINSIIEIPRMDLVQGASRAWFEDFDLDTAKGFDYSFMDEEIIVVDLTREQKRDTIGVVHGAALSDTPQNQIISELMNYPEIDYELCADLLFKLTTQAITAIESRLTEPSKLPFLIRQSKKLIASRIYEQMKAHHKFEQGEYTEPKVLPFVRIEPWTFSVQSETPHDYRETISQKSMIPKLLFTGFFKACHETYKFDSSTEKDFASILESDASVIKWMRPAPNQFRLYWDNNSKRYEPDFVVETSDAIYLVETKEAGQVETAEVQLKKQAAEQYCKYASAYTQKHGGKPWKYLLIPHDKVGINFDFKYYLHYGEK